jgi:hypothetical protein
MGDNPATGYPYGGRDSKPDDASQPGERKESESHGAPAASSGNETASRAAQEGPMSSTGSAPQPTPGVDGQVQAPSPADATEGSPPGGSTANQSGRDE